MAKVTAVWQLRGQNKRFVSKVDNATWWRHVRLTSWKRTFGGSVCMSAWPPKAVRRERARRKILTQRGRRSGGLRRPRV